MGGLVSTWARRGGMWLVAAFACFILVGGCQPENNAVLPEPQIEDKAALFEVGDQFTVRVYGEEGLSGDFQVQDDGSITFPLLGSVQAKGKTQTALARELEAALGDGFLKDPNVTVLVTERENLEVSVLGEVEKPGSIPFAENLSLVQAISAAGGMSPLAAPKRVKLTRSGPEGPTTVVVSIKDITEGRRADVMLRPGDIVYVPESPI